MQGLELHALQSFLRSSYGQTSYKVIERNTVNSRLSNDPLRSHEDLMIRHLIESASRYLGQAEDSLLEDFGTWLIAAPEGEPLRRLLRFGGETFLDFLYSLEELPTRIALALPELVLPQFEVKSLGDNSWVLYSHMLPPYLHVTTGLLRAMADDYGALVVLTPHSTLTTASLHIKLITACHAQARDFSLAHGL